MVSRGGRNGAEVAAFLVIRRVRRSFVFAA